jgi:SNF2 family DNA or RNA helicase
MTSEQARAELVRIERENSTLEQDAVEIEAQLALLKAQLVETKRASINKRRDLVDARRKLEHAQVEEQAQERALEIEARNLQDRAEFESLYADRVWFKGTGNGDAILEHQIKGAMFGSIARRWILGDEMGLGKTRTSIAWLDLVDARKVIVVTPPGICNQFAGELEEYAPHREVVNLYKRIPVVRHQLLDTMLSKDEGVIVVNYEIWRRDKDTLAKLISWQADTLLVDEAHSIKTTSSANYKAISALVEGENTCPNCGGFITGLVEAKTYRKIPCETCGWRKGDALDDDYLNPLEEWLASRSVLNLCFTTGTPLLNSPEDIYSLLHLCDPKMFPTKANFLSMYCSNNRNSGKWEFLPVALKMLKPLIADRFLARAKEDAGVVVPTQHVHVIPIALDRQEYPKQYRLIRQISEAAQIILESGEKASLMHLISILTRKRQANVWPGGIKIEAPDGRVLVDVGTEVQESCKLDFIQDHIELLHESGNRQIVFSQFKTALAEFEVRLRKAGLRVVRYDGDTPAKLRTEIESNFYKAKGEAAKWDVLLANYKTGGTGLNLTSATKIHVLDEEWNPGKRDQAYHRVARMGQDQETDVYVYRLIGTVDTWIANTIRRKERMIDTFNETFADDAPELTVESLLEALRSGAVL